MNIPALIKIIMAFFVSLVSTFVFSHAQETGTVQHGVLFTNANIVDVKNGVVLNNMDVLVEENRIAGISKHKSGTVKKQKGLSIIPAAGKFIMPGLVDAHTHIIFKEELINYLTNGVTAVFSLGSPSTVLDYRQEIKEEKLVGPDIYAGAMLDGIREDWGGMVLNKTIHSDSAVANVLKEVINEGWDFIKTYNNLSTQVFDAVMEFANANQIPVIGHAVREPGFERVIASGMGMLAHAEEYVYTFFKGGMEETKIPEAVFLTKKYGVYVCPNLLTFRKISQQWGDSLAFVRLVEQQTGLKNFLNPFTFNSWFHNNPYLHRDGSVDSMYFFLEKLTYALFKAGVPLVAGTDSPIIPGCFPGYSLAEDLVLLTNAGLSNADALKCATLNPGLFIEKYFKNPLKLGLVEVGYQADLLLLDNNPFDNLQHVRNLSGVMTNGNWYTIDTLITLRNKTFNR